MINFVLQHPRVIAGGLESDLLAVAVERLDSNRLEARHLSAPEKRDGKTTLGIFFHLGPDPFVRRVEERRQRDFLLLALAGLRMHLVEKDAQRREYLRSRDPGSIVFAHRVFQI